MVLFFFLFIFIFFSEVSKICFFSAHYNALVCFLVSPTPTAIPTMTHRPEEDTFGVSVVFSPEIESTYMKYYEVSQRTHGKGVENKPHSKPFFFSFIFLLTLYRLSAGSLVACVLQLLKYFRSSLCCN